MFAIANDVNGSAQTEFRIRALWFYDKSWNLFIASLLLRPLLGKLFQVNDQNVQLMIIQMSVGRHDRA